MMKAHVDSGGHGPSTVSRVRFPHAIGAIVRRVEPRLSSTPRVLVYHRIGDENTAPLNLSVSPQHFEEQVCVLANRASAVGLGDLLSSGMLLGRRSASLRFSITFDDGYADALTAALPVLEHYDVPATVFVASGFIDRPFFWWDRFAEIVREPATRADVIADAGEYVGLMDAAQAAALRSSPRAEVYRQMTRALERLGNSDRYGFVEYLESSVGYAPRVDSLRPLTSIELAELATHPLITIGNHTRSHQRLTSLSPDEAYVEIAEGDHSLDRLIGSSRTKRPLAYPHGDADHATAKIAARAGCRQAFTMVSRPISLIDSALLLPRIATSDVDGDEFARLRRLS